MENKIIPYKTPLINYQRHFSNKNVLDSIFKNPEPKEFKKTIYVGLRRDKNNIDNIKQNE